MEWKNNVNKKTTTTLNKMALHKIMYTGLFEYV